MRFAALFKARRAGRDFPAVAHYTCKGLQDCRPRQRYVYLCFAPRV